VLCTGEEVQQVQLTDLEENCNLNKVRGCG